MFDSNTITEENVDSETLTLLEDPLQLKYDDRRSQIMGDYEIMRFK